jgi:hypothetical protein
MAGRRAILVTDLLLPFRARWRCLGGTHLDATLTLHAFEPLTTSDALITAHATLGDAIETLEDLTVTASIIRFGRTNLQVAIPLARGPTRAGVVILGAIHVTPPRRAPGRPRPGPHLQGNLRVRVRNTTTRRRHTT